MRHNGVLTVRRAHENLTYHTTYPKGTLCMQMRDVLGTIYTDTDFAELFPIFWLPMCAIRRGCISRPGLQSRGILPLGSSPGFASRSLRSNTNNWEG